MIISKLNPNRSKSKLHESEIFADRYTKIHTQTNTPVVCGTRPATNCLCSAAAAWPAVPAAAAVLCDCTDVVLRTLHATAPPPAPSVQSGSVVCVPDAGQRHRVKVQSEFSSNFQLERCLESCVFDRHNDFIIIIVTLISHLSFDISF